MKNLVFIFLISLFAISCDRKECFTPPEPLVFELVNTAGENLIANGDLVSGKFTVQKDLGNGNFQGMQISVREDKKLVISNVGFIEGIENYQFISEIKLFHFKVTSARISNDCGGYTIKSIDFQNLETSRQSGYYRIVLE